MSVIPGSLDTPGVSAAADKLFGVGGGAAAGGGSFMASAAPWLLGAQVLSGLNQAPPAPQHIPQPQTPQQQQPSMSLGEMLFNRPTEAAQAPGQFNKAPQFPGVM